MNIDETKNYVEQELAKKIRDKMKCIYDLLDMTSEEKFAILKEVSLLVTELLSNKETKQKFIALANNTKIKENSENNDIKFKAFEIIRHIVSHFPFFEKWDDVFITGNLLNWNNKNSDSIYNFFKKYIGMEIKYTIYTKQFDEWIPTHFIIMKLLPIKDEEPIYMKDVISEDDVIWTFGIIDHYLDFMGYGLKTCSCTSL